jgi:hypothetical protein
MSWWHDTTVAAALVRIMIVVACSAAAVALSAYEERRHSDYTQVRAVADAAQRALLRPVPTSALACRWRPGTSPAARLAQVGGDFYEVVPWGAGVRLVVGDVRGKGLDSVGWRRSRWARSARPPPRSRPCTRSRHAWTAGSVSTWARRTSSRPSSASSVPARPGRACA